MKKFVLKLFSIIIVFYIVAFSLQYFIDKCIKHSKFAYVNVWNDIATSKVDADIVVFGSSRAKQHYSPKLIDSVTNLKSCNLGMIGTGFNLQIARILLYLQKNKKPKYIIQNVDCIGTLNNQIFEVEQFLPFLNEPTIQKASIENNVYDYKDFYLPLYKYTHTSFTKSMIIDGVKGYFKNTYGENAFGNFGTCDNKWDSTFSAFQRFNKNGVRSIVDSLPKAKFEYFLDYCSKEHIKVILVYSPEYIGLQKMINNRDSVVNLYRNYALKYNFPYLDYSSDPICLDTLNFWNSQHMTKIGVNKFNQKLAVDLKDIIH